MPLPQVLCAPEPSTLDLSEDEVLGRYACKYQSHAPGSRYVSNATIKAEAQIYCKDALYCLDIIRIKAYDRRKEIQDNIEEIVRRAYRQFPNLKTEEDAHDNRLEMLESEFERGRTSFVALCFIAKHAVKSAEQEAERWKWMVDTIEKAIEEERK